MKTNDNVEMRRAEHIPEIPDFDNSDDEPGYVHPVRGMVSPGVHPPEDKTNLVLLARAFVGADLRDAIRLFSHGMHERSPFQCAAACWYAKGHEISGQPAHKVLWDLMTLFFGPERTAIALAKAARECEYAEAATAPAM